MPTRFRPERVEQVIAAMNELRDAALARERTLARTLERIPAARRASARNLLHYLALRGRDVRLLQRELASLGLSSLGRCEAHVLATMDAVLAALHRVSHRPMTRPLLATPPVDFERGSELLEQHADELLGPRAAELKRTHHGDAAL